MSNDADQDDDLRLRWTREPHEPCPYSDWTIEVFLQQDDEDAAAVPSLPPSSNRRYAVHRNMLGFRSMYFRKVFADCNKEFSEGTKRESKIGLPHQAVDAFEVLLDFFYSSENKLALERSNAVGLFFLGDYLQIQILIDRVECFVEDDIDDKNCAFYFEKAKELHIQYIRDRVAQFCCENPDSLSYDSDLMAIADVDLMKAFLTYHTDSWYGTEREQTCRSTIISDFYFRHMRDDCRPSDGAMAMDYQTFLELTDSKLLPSISAEAAVIFLCLEKEIRSGDCVDGHDDCHPVSKEAKMTNLQARCVASLNASSPEQYMDQQLAEDMRTWCPVVVRSLLISSLKKQMELEEKNKALSRRIHR